MCGLYGIAGRGIMKEDLQVYYQLGLVNMLRGQHSTGYYESNMRSLSKLLRISVISLGIV